MDDAKRTMPYAVMVVACRQVTMWAACGRITGHPCGGSAELAVSPTLQQRQRPLLGNNSLRPLLLLRLYYICSLHVRRLLWQLTMRCCCCVVVVTMICDVAWGTG
jgi:hypothetical protein